MPPGRKKRKQAPAAAAAAAAPSKRKQAPTAAAAAAAPSHSQPVLASLPVYEGKDPNTEEFNRCSACGGDGGEGGLKRCGRCSCVYFCSDRCERGYRNQHTGTCNAIAKAERAVERAANKLDPSLFETQAGDFWDISETRAYMRARIKLADLIYDIAYEKETVELWERVVAHYQELLRLNDSDNMGLRYRFPFLLLYLNRDDDAYSFCRYWENWEIDDEEERERRHTNSSEGDWIYPREEGCRYNDFFAECQDDTREFMSLAMLVAVCIIKMRLVAAYDDKKKRGVVQDESAVHVQRIEANRRQVQDLMDQIHANNPSMLPSILNPTPMKSQGLPEFHSPGHPTEAAFVLNDCHRAFVRVPGAEDLLKARFGPRPTYNHSFSLR